ncbi:MAG: hypothetical protein K0S45_2449 [Nitrospira sp.]|nr:hypothetical protein [Nitrospira sp.]
MSCHCLLTWFFSLSYRDGRTVIWSNQFPAILVLLALTSYRKKATPRSDIHWIQQLFQQLGSWMGNPL